MLQVMDDLSIWKSFKQGDKEAYSAIYSTYFNNLYEYGMRIAGEKELVKDSIHDLFVKLWTNRSRLAEISNIKSYLLVSIRSTIYNKLEQNKRMVPGQPEDDQGFELTFSAESAYIRKEAESEQTRKIMEAMNQLTYRQKEVIYLRYFEELDYNQVALIMNISVKSTYKLTARGLDMLRQIMNMSKFSLLAFITLARVELLH